MDNCVFCKIARGEIPVTKVFEDDDFIAFLDIHPVNKGHVLVIPKEHYEKVYDMPSNLSSKYFPIINKIATAMNAALPCRRVVMAVWGEDVAHAHLHLIPRYENDNVRFWKQYIAEEDEISLVAEKIIKKLD